MLPSLRLGLGWPLRPSDQHSARPPAAQRTIVALMNRRRRPPVIRTRCATIRSTCCVLLSRAAVRQARAYEPQFGRLEHHGSTASNQICPAQQ